MKLGEENLWSREIPYIKENFRRNEFHRDIMLAGHVDSVGMYRYSCGFLV